MKELDKLEAQQLKSEEIFEGVYRKRLLDELQKITEWITRGGGTTSTGMPVTVFMHDQDSGGLITIAEYEQEYGKENPIKVLYHGFDHYDALQIPGNKGAPSRL